MKKRILLSAGVLLLVAVMMLLLGSVTKPVERAWATYTVQPGDKLYDIAAELGVTDWRKWCYETCEINGIEQGGLIYPGDVLIVSMPAMK